MNQLTSGITPVSPSYPVRPVQPIDKDRQPEEKQRRERKQTPGKDKPKSQPNDDNRGDKPLIDEHV